MKVVKFLGFGLIFVLMFFGLFNIVTETMALKIENRKINATLKDASEKNVYFKNKIEYLEKPENILKEAKSELPYKDSNEKVIIIVKPVSTSSKP